MQGPFQLRNYSFMQVLKHIFRVHLARLAILAVAAATVLLLYHTTMKVSRPDAIREMATKHFPQSVVISMESGNSATMTTKGAWKINATSVISNTSNTTLADEHLSCSNVAKRIVKSNNIPPLIHWTSRDGLVPAKLVPMVNTWRLLLVNSTTASATVNWTFMHWSDTQISELVSVHYPWLANSYAKLVNGLERSDIGRLVVLHHLGGIYIDMDVELRRDLSPWILCQQSSSSSSSSCTSAVWTQEPVERAVFHYDLPYLVSNAVIMSRANHSFLDYVLHAWQPWFETNWVKTKKKRGYGDAVLVTGPIMLHHFYQKYVALPRDKRQSDWATTKLVEPEAFQSIWEQMRVPDKVKARCRCPKEKLKPLERRHCERLKSVGFHANKTVSAVSFTVHRFMHLSYTDKMDLTNAMNIDELMPILKCTV